MLPMNSEQKYLTGTQVRARYGISEMTLWRWLQDSNMQFPIPMVINRRRFFKESEITYWEQARIAKAA